MTQLNIEPVSVIMRQPKDAARRMLLVLGYELTHQWQIDFEKRGATFANEALCDTLLGYVGTLRSNGLDQQDAEAIADQVLANVRWWRDPELDPAKIEEAIASTAAKARLAVELKSDVRASLLPCCCAADMLAANGLPSDQVDSFLDAVMDAVEGHA